MLVKYVGKNVRNTGKILKKQGKIKNEWSFICMYVCMYMGLNSHHLTLLDKGGCFIKWI